MNRSVITRLVKLEAAAAALPARTTERPPWHAASLAAAERYLCGQSEPTVQDAIDRGQLVYIEASRRWLTGASAYWREVLGRMPEECQRLGCQPHIFDWRTVPDEDRAAVYAAGGTEVDGLSRELAGGMWPPHRWQLGQGERGFGSHRAYRLQKLAPKRAGAGV